LPQSSVRTGRRRASFAPSQARLRLRARRRRHELSASEWSRRRTLGDVPGFYGRHTSGPAYISGAVAWGGRDVTLNRTIFVNNYRADFDGNAITGRLEGGWRFAYGTSGITPYAAGQVTGFFLPGYAEQLVAGVSTFALAYSGSARRVQNSACAATRCSPQPPL
jgi:hypothetical protein